jgi:ApaG protein
MYRAITRDIQVTVTPKYLDERSTVDGHQYFWAYTVVIDNFGEASVQLKARYWHITDQLGRVQEVRGVGVVGEQPVLAPGASYEYTSGVPLPTPTGVMAGRYQMETETGETFWVDIPTFSLDSPHIRRVIN